MAQSELSHVVPSKPHGDHRIYHGHIQSIVCGTCCQNPFYLGSEKVPGTPAVLLQVSSWTEQLSVHTAAEHTTSKA